MWIPKTTWDFLFKHLGTTEDDVREERAKRGYAEGLVARLVSENERLRADLDWFKFRLSQVERERGQLIQTAIGVKISVPEFTPAGYDPAAALNGLPNLSTVGEDAMEPAAADPMTSPEVDYSQMPGYKRQE